MKTVTVAEPVLPMASVTKTVYVCVAWGMQVGLETLVALSPVAGAQE
jgi:hypothetical protein